MLTALLGVVLLWLLGALVVARVLTVVLRRLGLELMTVLVWFGLAEVPPEGPSRRERRGLRLVEPSRAA